jgi:hypothetical protein
MDSDEPVFSGRSVDIELGGQEVITIDLDNLDPNPEDVLDLLKDGQCRIWVWTKLAGEYWRRGYLEAAEKIALAAIECASPLPSSEGLELNLSNSISGQRYNGVIAADIFPTGEYSNRPRPTGTKNHSA